jgi:hypothetical protein
VHTVVVCLASAIPPPLLAERAAAALTARGLAAVGVLPHFVTRTRRTGKLIDRWQGLTAGGPIRLLDLDRMRRYAIAAATVEWSLWQHAVADTKPALPLWWFLAKHHNDPGRYRLSQAREDYLAQPRILAMTAYNAVPHRPCRLPLSAVEAFQTGYHTYLNVAWLAAVPADGLAPEHGGWLTPRSDRLADQLDFLAAANTHLAQVRPDTHLVAMAAEA